MNRLIAKTWAAGVICAAMMPIRQAAAVCTVSLDQIVPVQHDVGGGDVTYLYGTGFCPGLEVLFNGKAATIVRYSSTTMACRVPSNPAGTYDVVVRDGTTHMVLDTLPMGIQYVAGKIPAPEDIRTVRLDDNRVKLTWSNLVNNDFISIRRNGSTLITLPGNSTQYTDTNAPYTGQSIRYELMGTAPGGHQSGSVAAENVPFICYEHLGLGATGRAGDSQIVIFQPLPGREHAQICFRLAAPADALRVHVHAARGSRDGILKARIHPAADTGTTLATITFTDIDAISERATWTDGITGTDLAAGDYLLGFFIDGNAGQVGLFGITADAAEEDAGRLMVAPCTPPPYPLVRIFPLCGNVAPNIISLRQEIPDAATSNFLIDGDGFFGGVLPLPDRTLELRCEAEDVDGDAIHYFWLFGDGGRAESGGPTITHEFPGYHTYTVVCSVLDNAGGLDSESLQVTVTPLSVPCPAGGPPCIGAVTSPNSPPGSDGDPGALSFLPDIDPFIVPNVVQTYHVQVTPPEDIALRLVNPVSMRLLDSSTGLCLDSTAGGCLQRTATLIGDDDHDGVPDHPFGPSNWESMFNTDQFPNVENFDLEVTATASNGMQSIYVVPDLPLCDRPILAHPILDGIVDTTIEYDSPTHTYALTATMPPNPIYDHTFNLDIIPGVFELSLLNQIIAGLTVTEDLTNQEWFPRTLVGDLQVTLLNQELASEHFDVDLQFAGGELSFPCDDYAIHYHHDGFPIYDQDWEWELFDASIYEGFVGPVYVSAHASVDVGLGIDVMANFVDARVQVPAPHLDASMMLTPTVTAWADANVEVELLWGLADATGTLRPTIGLTFPTTIHVQDTDPKLSVDVDDCLSLDLDAKVEACLFLAGCVDTGWMEIFSKDFGDACPAGAAGARDPSRSVAPAGAPAPQPLALKYPSIAITPDGSKTMIVFAKDIDADPGVYNAEIYYSVDSGAGFPAPSPRILPADSFTQRDPSVVFLSNTTALAVWTEGRLTHAQETALNPATTIAGMNGVFKNQDIALATWTAAGGWAARQFLVNDGAPNPLISDGRPAVAPILNNVANPNSAWVVWVRSDNQEIIDGAGKVKLSGMSIYARKIFNGAPSGSMVKLSAGDEASPAADLQPDVAVSPSGNVVIAVWVRNMDSNFDTATDRMLMYSVLSGGSWSVAAAVTSPGALPGVLMPSVTLSSDVNGMIAFTVRDSRYEGSVLKVTGEGNRDAVYTIEIKNTVFQAPAPLQRPRNVRNGTLVKHQGHDRDGRVYGCNPIVRYLDTSNATVVFRSFDGYGPQGGDGELAIATIDLSQASPKWSLARDLTQDAYRDWEVAAAVGPNGSIRTVRDSAAPGSPAGFDGLTAQKIATTTPDLAVDRVRVSNPRTPPGTQVTLTAVIRNNGLRTPGSPQSTFVRLGKVVNNVFQQISAVPFFFTAPPDQTQTVAFTLWMPVEATTMRVTADAIPGEILLTNNAADVVLGVLPPVNLQCSDLSQGNQMRAGLKWKNGEPYELIAVYRDGRLLDVLAGGRESYIDHTVGLGAHLWSVRGRIASAESDPDAAFCGLVFYARMDYDHDLDVDEADFDIFRLCRTGPKVPYNPSSPPTGCTLPPGINGRIAADLDADGDVDHDDFGRFQHCYGGANITPHRGCLD